MRIDRDKAREILRQSGVPLGTDFHALNSEQVEGLLSWATACRYRKPRNANGSRGRYWHAYLVRTAERPD